MNKYVYKKRFGKLGTIFITYNVNKIAAIFQNPVITYDYCRGKKTFWDS